MQPGLLPEALKPLCWLVGRWKSITADGIYPTIKPFSYCEELSFESCGQPLLNYQSKTWNPTTGAPMHLESGFLRINPGTNQVAFMIAHNFGLTTLEEGSVCGKQLKVKAAQISRMSFVRDPKVLGIEREYKLDDDGKMELVVHMETTTTPLTEHLRVVYEKCE